MTQQNIPVVENILSANDQIASSIRKQFDDAGIFAINIMASPGAGKTSVIESTIKALNDTLKVAVIEGDLASSIDAEHLQKFGIEAIQINTGGGCHLEAGMLQQALGQLDLASTDLLVVENVGNLICPSAWKLGTHKNVLIASVPEGDDKPYKYPTMYRGVDALILNKIDLMPYIDFDMDYFKRGVEVLNANLTDLSMFEVSCTTGEGIDQWVGWLQKHVESPDMYQMTNV